MLPLCLFLVALVTTATCAALGPRLGLVDRPDARKHHRGNIPLTGGIAVFLTVLFASLVLGVAPYTWAMLTIATAVFALGVFDDLHHIDPWLRLLLHYGAGILLATYGGIVIVNVGNLLGLGDIPLLLLAVPLTALSVAGLANAYNMIDGIDGLAAGTVAIPLLTLTALAVANGHPDTDAVVVMLVPLLVFLMFNLGPNSRFVPKVFLGDGGSVTLGFLVTASLVHFSQGEQALIAPVTALWLVTVPLMDMLATMLRRWRAGYKLMEADRSHLHHSLMDLGLSPRQTLGVLSAWACTCALLGLALERLPAYISMGCYLLLFLGHLSFVVAASRRLIANRDSGTPGNPQIP